MTIASSCLSRACLAASVAVSAIVLSACGGGSPPQGKWACEGDAMGAKETLNTTYAADGKTSGTGGVKVDQPGMAIDIKVSYTGKWSLKGDQLTEQMTDAKITEGTMNGQPLPEELKGQLVQGMGAETTSTMKVDGSTMTLTNNDITMTCKK